MNHLGNFILVPLCAFFYSQSESKTYIAALSDDFKGGKYFGKIMRYQAPTNTRRAVATTDEGVELLLGFHHEISGAETVVGTPFEVFKDVLAEKGGDGLPKYANFTPRSFYDGPKTQRKLTPKVDSVPAEMLQGVDIIHFRAWNPEADSETVAGARMTTALSEELVLRWTNPKYDSDGLSAKGGATLACSLDPKVVNENLVQVTGDVGLTLCSYQNNFCRKEGARIAAKRLRECQGLPVPQDLEEESVVVAQPFRIKFCLKMNRRFFTFKDGVPKLSPSGKYHFAGIILVNAMSDYLKQIIARQKADGQSLSASSQRVMRQEERVLVNFTLVLAGLPNVYSDSWATPGLGAAEGISDASVTSSVTNELGFSPTVEVQDASEVDPSTVKVQSMTEAIIPLPLDSHDDPLPNVGHA